MLDGGRVGIEKEGHGPVISSVQPNFFPTQVFLPTKLLDPTFLSQPPHFPLAFYLHPVTTHSHSKSLDYITLAQFHWNLSVILQSVQNLPPGSVPTVSEGVVSSTACINQVKRKRFEAKMEQIFGAGPGVLRGRAWHRCEKLLFLGGIQVNTYSHSTQIPLKPIFLYRHHFRLVPTPACNMGYCVGEGVPCPKGLASTNGYTPCDCESTTLSTSSSSSINMSSSSSAASATTLSS